jgi:hypothetical protein
MRSVCASLLPLHSPMLLNASPTVWGCFTQLVEYERQLTSCSFSGTGGALIVACMYWTMSLGSSDIGTVFMSWICVHSIAQNSSQDRDAANLTRLGNVNQQKRTRSWACQLTCRTEDTDTGTACCSGPTHLEWLGQVGIVAQSDVHDMGTAPVHKRLFSKPTQQYPSLGKPFLEVLCSVLLALCLQVLGRRVRDCILVRGRGHKPTYAHLSCCHVCLLPLAIASVLRPVSTLALLAAVAGSGRVAMRKQTGRIIPTPVASSNHLQ